MSEMMRAALWVGPEQIEVREIERPVPGPGEALIKVAYGGICGTDMMIYLGVHPRSKPPLVMSHEFAGTVVEADGDQFAPGTPVAINPLISCGKCWACTHGQPHVCEKLGLVGIDLDGGFAEYVVVSQEMLHVVPDSVPLVEAALVEPLAVAVHAVRVSDLKVGDTTVVLGAGPVGILAAQVARMAGARVIVSEMSNKRLSIARQLGFETVDVKEQSVVEYTMDVTKGAGVPVVFEMAGVQPTLNDAAKAVRIGGQILQVGIPKKMPTVDLTNIIFKEVRRTPTRVYRDEDVEIAVQLTGSPQIDLVKPVTHILPLADLGKGMEIAHAAQDACKILIAPNV